MEAHEKIWPAIIVGGGPCGIAAAAELKKQGIESLIIEKGSVTESIRRYPRRMTFFSTAENIEIAGIPFATSNVKANRNEALQYYRKVAQYYDLHFKLNTKVASVKKVADHFQVHTDQKESFRAEFIILATGYFDKARQLNIPGENLPNVSHYYEEPYAHSFQKVTIVGAGNSGISAALELYRHNVEVTLIARGEDLKPTAKYWLVPDIRNRIKEGKIRAIYHAEAKEISETEIRIAKKDGSTESIPSDFNYLLVGYLPDVSLLRACGLHPDPVDLMLDYNPETYESEIADFYLCGTVLAGVRTEKVFIENGRDHAIVIAKEIAGKLKKVPV